MLEPKLLIKKLEVVEKMNDGCKDDILRELEVFEEEYYKLHEEKFGEMNFEIYREIQKAFKEGFLLGNLLSRVEGGGPAALDGVKIPMYEEEDENGFLVAYVDLSKDKRQWIVTKCPRCGQSHTHGAGNGTTDDPREFLGRRGAHCFTDLSGHPKPGYVLRERS